MQTSNFVVEDNKNELSLISSFREDYQKKQCDINFDIIGTAINQVESFGFIPPVKEKDLLEEMLFIQQVKDKTLMMEPTDDLISYFVNSSTSKKL